MNYQVLRDKAKRIRASCVRMAHDGNEGHLGSALSCVDILVALYAAGATLQHHDPDTRVYFSKGHACSALYATWAEIGYIPKVWLDNYAKPGSCLTPHPDWNMLPQLEMSAGSLGHGLGIAAGAAYASKLQGKPTKHVVIMGDGECNEGSVWEAAQWARAYKLDNLTVIVDYNRIQSIGRTDEISGDTSLVDKFKAFGWMSCWVNGHNFSEIQTALGWNCVKPLAIIAKTVGGKGVSFMTDQILWYYRVPSEEEVKKALVELG